MPPWLPESGHGEFAGERRLSASEIETIRRWAEAGAPDGDAAAPAPPRFTKGWQLGKPDSEARVREPFQAPAEGPDLYQCFVIPLALAQDRHVRAIEFRPGNRRLVHHALLFQDRSGNAARRGSSYPCFGTPGFFGGALGGWSPGTSALQLPVPVTIQKGAALVLQLHFHPTGRPETDQSAVGLYFTDTPPRTRVMDIPLGSRAIDIPPGERHYRVRDHFTLPVAVRAVGIIPHAHYICREMEGVAVLPDGSRRPLIRIRDWNFNWQEQYRYSQPVPLPAGTRLEMEFTYDNSEDNPRNPNSPPRRVTWGPGTTDEMAGLHVQVIPENSEDLPELGQALWGKFMRSVGGGFYRRR
jgi:hypothetical protein